MAQEVNAPVIYAEPETQPVTQPVLKPTIDGTKTSSAPLRQGDMSNRWSGTYVGLQMSYTMLRDSLPAEGNGVTYGALVGHNIAVMGRFVAGIEGSYTHMNIEFDDGSGVRGKDTLAVRMRGGYAADRFYAYGLIGADHAIATAPFAPGYNFKDTALVWGAGVDVAVTDHIAVGVEYTRSVFKEFDYPVFPIPVDVTMQKVQSRLTYKLD